jgi:hypothetical protein
MFSLTGNQLTIELKNTAGANSQKYVDTDVLTGVFFGTDPQDLKPVSATAPHTVDTAGNPLCVVDCDTGTGWEYKSLTTPQFGFMNGLTVTVSPVFLFSNFSTTSTKLHQTSNGVVPNTYPDPSGTLLNESNYAVGSTIFTMVTPDAFTLATIQRIAFMWGTSADNVWAYGEGSLFFGLQDEAPEPATWGLIGAALAALALKARRRA